MTLSIVCVLFHIDMIREKIYQISERKQVGSLKLPLSFGRIPLSFMVELK